MQVLVLSGVLGLSVTSIAAAESDAPERVRLTYSAGAGCPAEATFSGEVKARIHRTVTWTERPPARQISVKVEVVDGDARGELEIVEPSGERTTRAIAAETCAEVASGLALVVALALDPNASTEPLPPPATSPPDAPSPPSAPVTRAASEPRRSALRVFGGLAAGIGAGYAPEAMVRAGALVGVRYDTASSLSPSFRLSPAWAKTGETGPQVGEATFTWMLVRIDACPLRLEASRSLFFTPCASSELGSVVVRGDADAIDVPEEKDRLWADLGPSLLTELRFGSFFVELGGVALVTLTRDTFFFATPGLPRADVHDTPFLVYGATLALGGEL